MSKSYAEIEGKVYQWGCERGIVQNGKPMSQALKALEEVQELLSAINRCSESEVVDAMGDVWVCLLMTASIMNLNLVDCMYAAYDDIKDRKGFLRQDGTFIKSTT